ncbi:MAG: hypothetical protein methR_P0744 [Methyloprofundus sp.]|nr:MAG: hypothetical protein methR_P0744 [Methyloprofundus sp.]
MRANIIIYSGYWNIGLAATLICPAFYHALGMNISQPVWGWVIAGFLLYTAATLIISGRTVDKYASIVIYEAGLRFIAAILLVPAGLFYDYGFITAFLGVTDAVWGVVYLQLVPKLTGRSLKQLLLD